MSKRTWLLVASLFMFILILVVGYLIIFNKHRVIKETSNEQQSAITNSTPATINVDSSNQQTVKVTSSPLPALDNQQVGNAQQNLVDPKTFSQYEKYNGSSNCLFGEIITGTGAEVVAGSKVAIYYSGWLTNGTLFDNSKNDTNGNQQPFLFTEGAHEVILGMEEGIAGMKVGGKRLIIVPPAVGYGSKVQGSIPANSTLVFEVTLGATQ